jgi:hypothetical protein
MKDMKAHLEKLQAEVAECEMIRDLATEARAVRSPCGSPQRIGWRGRARDPIGGGNQMKQLGLPNL